MKRVFILSLKVLALSLVFFAISVLPVDAKKKTPTPKYVFYMIGDGMGINSVRGTEIYNEGTGKGPSEINFNHFPVKTFVNTHSANSLVTDSAAGGTALSTGFRTFNNGEGVDENGNPVSTVLEWAKEKGFGAGVATSVGVNHATPSAFYGHDKSRSSYETLAMQLFSSKLDFAAGAGFLNEVRKTGHDSAYLEKQAESAGFTILRGSDQCKRASSVEGRLLCLSGKNENELPYAIDRNPDDTKLADFVQAGIDYLYANYAKKGFFFMVEGGKIDYSAHADDGVTTFAEINDFAESIDLVLDFYNQHPDETLIIVTADHETGACMLGAGLYEMHADRMAYQQKSETVLTSMFREKFSPRRGQRDFVPPTYEDIKAFLSENLGLWSKVEVDAEGEKAIKAAYDESFGRGQADGESRSLYSSNSRLVHVGVEYLNRTAGYVWAHTAHSGSPVGLYVKGACAEAFMSCENNVDIPVVLGKVASYK